MSAKLILQSRMTLINLLHVNFYKKKYYHLKKHTGLLIDSILTFLIVWHRCPNWKIYYCKKLTSYCLDKVNLWPFSHLTFKSDLDLHLLEQMFQMALLLLQDNNCAILFWNPCKNVQVMALTNLDRCTKHAQRRHIHQTEVVTTISGSLHVGLMKRMRFHIHVHHIQYFWKYNMISALNNWALFVILHQPAKADVTTMRIIWPKSHWFS